VFFGGLDRLDRQREPARSQSLVQLGREPLDAEIAFPSHAARSTPTRQYG
jgi:hypothetical protein